MDVATQPNVSAGGGVGRNGSGGHRNKNHNQQSAVMVAGDSVNLQSLQSSQSSQSSKSTNAKQQSTSLSFSYLIPSHPFIDTLALLVLFSILPTSMACFIFILNISSDSSVFLLGKFLSGVFKKINGAGEHNHNSNGNGNGNSEPSSSSSSSQGANSTSFATTNRSNGGSIGLFNNSALLHEIVRPLLLSLSIDAFVVCVLLFFSPGLLKFSYHLSKAFIASNLSSYRSSSNLNAFASFLSLLAIGYLFNMTMSYFDIYYFPLSSSSLSLITAGNTSIQNRGDNSDNAKNVLSNLSSSLSSPSFITSSESIIMRYFYRLHKTFVFLILNNSKNYKNWTFLFYFIQQTIYPVLSIHTIILNIKPFLKKNSGFSLFFTKSLDQFSNITFNYNYAITNTNIKSKRGTLNYAEQEIPTVKVDYQISKSSCPSIIEYLNNSENVDQNNNDRYEAPASFPSDQLSNIRDISTAFAVVSENFMNYCIQPFSSLSSNCSTFYPAQQQSQLPSSPSLSQSIKKSTLSSSNATTATSTTSSSLLSTTTTINSTNNKGNENVRFHQPLWSLIAAAKTMFSRLDLYSGESVCLDSSDGALVHNKNEFTRNLINDPVQCFVFLTGENDIGLELFGAIINTILIRVNGVAWYQIVSGVANDVDYVFIRGLTPLSQYDIEVINVNKRNEKELLCHSIISTTSNNSMLIHSKKSTPLDTLQQSLATTNNNLNREKLKLKKQKKDYSKKIHSYKSEIEILKKKLSNNDKSDERNFRKICFLRQTLTSLEQEYSKINDEILNIYNIENELHEKYLQEKKIFDKQFRKLTSFENDYNMKKNLKLNKILSLQNDLSTLNAKNEKLIKKKLKIVEELDALQEYINNLKIEDVEFRLSKRKDRESNRAKSLNKFGLEISKLEKENEGLKAKNIRLRNQL
ncbi:hypothetical protein PACTADRAFT_185198 [Pachysolen tannophilus NRRL Y-2460]|uniref:Uncharacterized protein n=1 Tax=Pachysolen tannophilus NRRL Y-2460 TaxID=669874 RepID=A0A1E4U2V2_PACTA|nr:hypothetical protein PACTADRAFT_185198 [Pachysolen tannophilus NRRL Y-2460]